MTAFRPLHHQGGAIPEPERRPPLSGIREAPPGRMGGGGRAMADRQLWVLSGWLCIVFLTGGGSRPDIASLMVLRPAAILLCGYALATLTRRQMRESRMLLCLAGALILLHLAHLAPLPPEIWQALPGRRVIAENDAALGLGNIWRPMTMAPAATWNSLWSLAVPLATLLLAIQLDRRQLARLVPLLLALGCFSAALGVLQLFGDPQGPLYLYRITNSGAAVGLFANRNHHALFLACLLAMLLVWRFGRERPGLRDVSVTAAFASLLFLMILVIGSRSGVLLAVLAIGACLLIVGARRRPASRHGLQAWLLPGALVGLAALALLAGRGIAVERLLESGLAQELRIRILPILARMASDYAPWGSGLGSFEAVFEMYEPRAIISEKYMNHAHNDWVEIILTGGFPFIIITAYILTMFALCSVYVFHNETLFNKNTAYMGYLLAGIFSVSSIGDYPLRIPSLSAFAVIVCVFAMNKVSSVGNLKTCRVVNRFDFRKLMGQHEGKSSL